MGTQIYLKGLFFFSFMITPPYRLVDLKEPQGLVAKISEWGKDRLCDLAFGVVYALETTDKKYFRPFQWLYQKYCHSRSR